MFKILLLEDNAADARLIKENLKASGISFNIDVVFDGSSFKKAVNSEYDAILSDHNLPGFSATEALKIRNELKPSVPFILVTGAVSEEFAVEILHRGADDYILKDRMPRLAKAILKAIERKKIDQEHQKFLKRIMADESLLRETEKLAHVGSWQYDLVIGKMEWSDETFRIYGYQPDETVPSFDLFTNHILKEDYELIKTKIENTIAHFHSFKSDFRIVDNKGHTKYITFELVVQRNAKKQAELVTGFVQDITEQKEAEKQLKKSHQQLRSLAAHLHKVREEERIGIAREIHDELGQQLTGLKLELAWCNKVYGADEKIKQKISSMTHLLNDTIKTVRRISSDLRPAILDDLGLVAALEWQTKEFQKRTGVKAHFSAEFNDEKVDSMVSISIFRIYQEALTNIAKHANATQVEAFLISNGNVFLRIADNGHGFDPKAVENKMTFGLTGMKERVLAINGRLKINSRIGMGTAIEVKVPVSSLQIKNDTYSYSG